MNRTLKEATVKRYYYETHDQLRTHLGDFVTAYNFARRLKTLKGLTPYEYICKLWTKEPQRFILDPIHQMPRLNNADHQCAPRPSWRVWFDRAAGAGACRKADRRGRGCFFRHP
jgi:hypothetical protein